MFTPGTILMERHALRPPCFQLQDGPSANGWMPVTLSLTPSALEKELAATGWTFFYMAGMIRATAFGLDRARMFHAALKRLITTVELQNCNCLEIDDVVVRSFVGMPYVRVSAHSRHIQKGRCLSAQ